MKIIAYLFCLLVGILPVSIAQPVFESANNIDPITGLPSGVPTNSFIKLSKWEGNLRVVDFNGIILETNFVYSPCIKFEDLNDDDLLKLLETRKTYTQLAVIGKPKYRTVDSIAFENKLRAIWVDEQSLSKKIATRLKILKEVSDYNVSASEYRRNMGMINSAMQNARAQGASVGNVANSISLNNTTFKQNQAVSHDKLNLAIEELGGETPELFNARSNVRQAAKRQNSLNNDLENAKYAAINAANNVASIQRAIQISKNACALHAAHLAEYGVNVSSSPPFGYIPPLLINNEVDAERMKSPNSKVMQASIVPSDSNTLAIVKSDDTSLEQKTVKFLIQYADSGLDGPQYNLAMRYFEGRGVIKDYNKGIEYLKKSAAQGNDDAKKKLNELGEK